MEYNEENRVSYNRHKVLAVFVASVIAFSLLVGLCLFQYDRNVGLQLKVDNLQEELGNLQASYQSLMDTHAEISNLTDEIHYLLAQKDWLGSIPDFEHSYSIFPFPVSVTLGAGGFRYWFDETAGSACYWEISLNSTSNSTYVRLAQNSTSLGDLVVEKTFGFSGRKIFFVFPSAKEISVVRFGIGNNETVAPAVDVTFYITIWY